MTTPKPLSEEHLRVIQEVTDKVVARQALKEIEQIRRLVNDRFCYDEMDYIGDMETLLRGYDRLRARNRKLVESMEKTAKRLEAVTFYELAQELRAAIENADGE